jgi:hypothetical protein
MKHLFGRVYFKKPCFIGIRCDSYRTAVTLNIIGGLVLVGIVVIIWGR